jgi:integrase
MRLVGAAETEQDAALFLTAAFTGLRASELRALRWRWVDVAGSLIRVERGFTDEGGEDLPKSYRVRSVPMMPEVALALSKLYLPGSNGGGGGGGGGVSGGRGVAGSTA